MGIKKQGCDAGIDLYGFNTVVTTARLPTMAPSPMVTPAKVETDRWTGAAQLVVEVFSLVPCLLMTKCDPSFLFYIIPASTFTVREFSLLPGEPFQSL